MANITLTASTRSEFGKGAARRLRRAHQIPAVLYGHGSDPLHVCLPGHETMLSLKQTNALFEVALDGTTILAVVKDVQVEPVHQVIEHIDLLIVTRGEKIAVDVPVHVVGESAPGTIHVVETQQLQLEAEATNLPSHIEVSIEGLDDGAAIHAGDIALPEGASLLTDPEHVVVTVSVPTVSAEDRATDEAEAAAAAAEA
jgi:large subunit ribosomal protein L25